MANEKRTRTMEQEWNEYRAQVVHPKAGHAQLRETKLAFYAGAKAMFELIKEATDAEDVEEAIDTIQGYDYDLFKFAKKVIGREDVL